MARWDRILYNGKQYVPAGDYDRVVEALRRYGTHRAECAMNAVPPRRGPCDCGWDAALDPLRAEAA